MSPPCASGQRLEPSRFFLRGPLSLVLLSFVSSGCADEPRVGVVDIQDAFQRSPLVMVAALQLKGDVGSVQRDIKQRGRALAELYTAQPR